MWATLARFDAALGVGRPGWEFSDHEYEKLETMGRLADARWLELGNRGAPGETRDGSAESQSGASASRHRLAPGRLFRELVFPFLPTRSGPDQVRQAVQVLTDI